MASDATPLDLPRLLGELCDGCPHIRPEVYAFDLPNGFRQWLCRSCYARAENPPARVDLGELARLKRNGLDLH